MADDEDFRAAQEDSFRSYAYSVLRSETEAVLVLDSTGILHFRVDGVPQSRRTATYEETRLPAPLPEGWFDREVFGEARVGIAFEFDPFGWTIAVTELRSRYFSDVDGILRTHAGILAASIFLASALCAVYLGYLLVPLERLSGAIERIAATGDLTLRARVENRDEIGLLGERFNGFVSTIEVQRSELREANLAERTAHETALQREAETLFLLGRISDCKDEKTGSHLARIGELSALFSRLLGQGEEEQDLLRNCAPLHDIGKIGIPEAILLKPGKLDPQETAVMGTHTTLGYELLRACQSRYLAEGAGIALTHHERWDGTGYPRGLRGGEIPRQGRIVAVLDVFDALVSSRPYKQAWDPGRALEYIVEQGGRQFDPELSELFRENFDRFAVWGAEG